jgi:hypothetical protein
MLERIDRNGIRWVFDSSTDRWVRPYEMRTTYSS